jgi:hypothetical protein
MLTWHKDAITFQLCEDIDCVCFQGQDIDDQKIAFIIAKVACHSCRGLLRSSKITCEMMNSTSRQA